MNWIKITDEKKPNQFATVLLKYGDEMYSTGYFTPKNTFRPHFEMMKDDTPIEWCEITE